MEHRSGCISPGSRATDSEYILVSFCRVRTLIVKVNDLGRLIRQLALPSSELTDFENQAVSGPHWMGRAW
jgi:hypothetical protein